MAKDRPSAQPGLIDRDYVIRTDKSFAEQPGMYVGAEWFCRENYRATVIAFLALAGRPVRLEVFKELAEDEGECRDFSAAITDLVHAGRIVPIDGKLVLCK